MVGDFVAKFNNAKTAGAYHGIGTSPIYDVCEGKEKTCKSFIWRYCIEDISVIEIEPQETVVYLIKNVPLAEIRIVTQGMKRHVPVYQYDLMGRFSQNTIVPQKPQISFIWLNVKGIVGACEGNSKTSQGFLWRYAPEKPEPTIYPTVDEIIILSNIPQRKTTISPKCHTPVYQFGINDRYIGRYDSINDACKKYNIMRPSDVVRVCEGGRDVCGGYTWRFAD